MAVAGPKTCNRPRSYSILSLSLSLWPLPPRVPSVPFLVLGAHAIPLRRLDRCESMAAPVAGAAAPVTLASADSGWLAAVVLSGAHNAHLTQVAWTAARGNARGNAARAQAEHARLFRLIPGLLSPAMLSAVELASRGRAMRDAAALAVGAPVASDASSNNVAKGDYGEPDYSGGVADDGAALRIRAQQFALRHFHSLGSEHALLTEPGARCDECSSGCAEVLCYCAMSSGSRLCGKCDYARHSLVCCRRRVTTVVPWRLHQGRTRVLRPLRPNEFLPSRAADAPSVATDADSDARDSDTRDSAAADSDAVEDGDAGDSDARGNDARDSHAAISGAGSKSACAASPQEPREVLAGELQTLGEALLCTRVRTLFVTVTAHPRHVEVPARFPTGACLPCSLTSFALQLSRCPWQRSRRAHVAATT